MDSMMHDALIIIGWLAVSAVVLRAVWRWEMRRTDEKLRRIEAVGRRIDALES